MVVFIAYLFTSLQKFCFCLLWIKLLTYCLICDLYMTQSLPWHTHVKLPLPTMLFVKGNFKKQSDIWKR